MIKRTTRSKYNNKLTYEEALMWSLIKWGIKSGEFEPTYDQNILISDQLYILYSCCGLCDFFLVSVSKSKINEEHNSCKGCFLRSCYDKNSLYRIWANGHTQENAKDIYDVILKEYNRVMK